MSFYQDQQVRRYSLFLLFFLILTALAGSFLCLFQIHGAETLYLEHSRVLASSLLEQGVSKTVIARALCADAVSPEGSAFLTEIGLGKETSPWLLPLLSRLSRRSLLLSASGFLFLSLLLLLGTFLFFRSRARLYLQAEQILRNYMDGDFSHHLPQNREGTIYRLFASAEQLASMLQSKNDSERQAKEFLKNTISDISHQLKTPLAAMILYQEILSDEPEHPDTVREFSMKMGTALKRMERLILSMLKITRLDTGNITFERRICSVSELISHSVRDLLERARQEEKEIRITGNPDLTLNCDLAWTSEAIGNLVKNALDHTRKGGLIRVSWEQTPAVLQLVISDDGSGIAPEDIHHIFKRFYRSKNSLDTEGIGLGLPLAKSILEGQGGLIFCQSDPGRGTSFILSFLTKP